MKKKSFGRETIRLSIVEGVFANFSFLIAGPGSIFITKFAVLLEALPLHFAFISAIGQVVQLFQPIRNYNHKKIFIKKKSNYKVLPYKQIDSLYFSFASFHF